MKTLFFITCISFFSIKIKAQDAIMQPDIAHRVELGFRFMPTVSAFNFRTESGGTVQGQATFGYGIGGMVAVNLTNHIAVQGEVIYNSLSQKYKDENLDRKINVDYVNVPLLLSLNTGVLSMVNLNFVMGPQFGYNVGSHIVTTGTNGQDTMQAMVVLKKGDMGFAYGGGVGLALNPERTLRLDLGYRGIFGVIDISKPVPINGSTKTYNVIDHDRIRTYSAFAGLTFMF